MRPEPKIFSVYSNIPLYVVISDRRSRKYGIVLGSIEDLCRQLGIEYEEMETCTKFSAPKNRLQLFIEKLHFSRTYYSNDPI